MKCRSAPWSASKYAFDPENHLAMQTMGLTQTTYQYDGAGELSRRPTHNILDQVNGQPNRAYDVKDVFVDGIYEAESTGCGPPAKITKYYTAFGRVIASRTNGVLSYSLADHLGSTTQQIDSTNTPGPAIKYFPFGAPRNGTASPERAFTGQQREDDSPLGMYYYHARFYSSVLGHFMSADTITTDGLNRYAYVRGNPLKYIDPTGRCGGVGADLCLGEQPCGEECNGLRALSSWFTNLDARGLEKVVGCALRVDCPLDRLPSGVSGEDIIRLSQAAIGANAFWDRVYTQNAGSTLGAEVTRTILQAGLHGTSDPYSLISDYGFNRLGSLFIGITPSDGSPALPGFFRAALRSLTYGTPDFLALGDGIRGGFPFWGRPGFATLLIDLHIDPSGSYDQFILATVVDYVSVPTIVGWSPDQRDILQIGGGDFDPDFCQPLGCGIPTLPERE